MPGTQSGKPPRRHIDNGLILTGAVLLAAYFAMRGWSELQSRQDVEAFEAARARGADAAAPSLVAEAPAEIAAAASLEPSQPDFSLWSEKRVQEYRASLAQGRATPQAVLSIPHLDIEVPVFNGASEQNLNRGAARILGTGAIGGKGNLGIAGHRDGFFRPLKDIQVGDDIALETRSDTQVYTVSSIAIVDPSDLSVLGPTDTPSITLVTCYPFYFVGHAPKRFIVRAIARKGASSL